MNRLSRLVGALRERANGAARRLNRSLDRLRFVNFLHEKASGLVHRMDWLYIALVVVASGSYFLPRNAWTGALTIVLAFPVVALAFLKLQHGARLCEQCAVEFPIDAPERADRHRRRFWLFHHSVGLLVFMTGATLACVPFAGESWVRYALLAPSATQILVALMARFHGSFEPWCPYCDQRGRGRDEVELAPDPSGGHGRPVPAM